MANIPKVKLNNGNQIPILGLGTWLSESGKVEQAVKDAIDVGYRHFDCAHIYLNQKEVGDAITAKISEGVVKRSDLFITSKLWNTFHRPGSVEPILRTTLKEMNLEYFDLYLIHWPFGFKEGDSFDPMGPDGYEYSDYDYVETWVALEEIYMKGLAKAIGISNFNKHQVERVLEMARIVPAVLQIECHPYLNQKRLIEFCKSKGISVIGYSPLGSPGNDWNRKTNHKFVLKDPILNDIAKKYKKTSAQIAIRYQIERGVIVIPKSISKKRIAENFSVFDFALSKDDVALINTLDIDQRIVTYEEVRGHRFYPFDDEY